MVVLIRNIRKRLKWPLKQELNLYQKRGLELVRKHMRKFLIDVCAICGTNQNLHLHHIDGRGKDKTDDPNHCIMLCSYCLLEAVHKNNKYWRKKLKELV